MPWTVEDVDKHKKGLTDKQKKQWVRIANSALARCLKKGGTDKTCTPSAIRQANGVVGNLGNYSFVNNIQEEGYEVEIKIHQGIPYLVAPVNMMVEGVHKGNHGPLLHTMEELGKFPESWDGIPVVVNHPEIDGIYVSANSPDIIEAGAVGRIYNTKVDGYKLKAEVWIDEDKLNEVSADLLADMNEGKPIEISAGMFVEEEEVLGLWHDEQYIAIAHNIRPDHLALLSDVVGACSIKDGCGIRANKKGENNMEVKEAIQTLRTEGFSVQQIGNYTEKGYRELMDLVYNKLRSMDSQNIYHYLEELYTDSLIYSKSGETEPKMYKQGYKLSDGKIEFVGTPIEVKKEIEFIVMKEKSPGLTRQRFSNNKVNKEVNKMSKEKETPCCEDLVNELITNKRTKFEEADKEQLLTLSEDLLSKLIPDEETKVDPKIEKTEKVALQINAEQALKVLKESMKTPEDFFKILPAEYQDSMRSGLTLHEARRAEMVKTIQDNLKEVWTEDELKTMDMVTLSKVHKGIPEAVDYSGNGGGIVQTNKAGGEPLYPVGVTFDNK